MRRILQVTVLVLLSCMICIALAAYVGRLRRVVPDTAGARQTNLPQGATAAPS